MYFSDQEKLIYKPEWSEHGYDPLHLLNQLIVASGGRLYEWVEHRNAAVEDTGDVSVGGRRTKWMLAAQAELELARVARGVFGFPDSPVMFDGEALERLFAFLEYLEGKGEAAGRPQESSENSHTPSPPLPHTNTMFQSL